MDSDHDLRWHYVEKIVTYFKCKFQCSRTRTRQKNGQGLESWTQEKLNKNLDDLEKKLPILKNDLENPGQKFGPSNWLASAANVLKKAAKNLLSPVFLGQRPVSDKTYQIVGSFCKTELNSELFYGGLEI